MSDTDEDFLMPNSVLTFPNEKTSYCIQPSFRNNMDSNFNPNHYMGFDQRSTYSGRKSPSMSLKSFPNDRMGYRNSYYRSAMSSRGSVYNERNRSPLSVRSTASNGFASAVDISLALKNVRFNKYELRLIQDSYISYMKKYVRRRVEKKRNLKSFIRHCGRKSGGESGDEGSDSSISSNDGKSTRFYKENIPRVPQHLQNRLTTQSESNNDVYTDCTENFKQNTLRNFLNVQSKSVHSSSIGYDRHQNLTHDYRNRYTNTLQSVTNDDIPQNVKNTEKFTETPQNEGHQYIEQIQNTAPTFNQKERFTKDASTLLLFQRFNKNNVKQTTYEVSYNEVPKKTQHNANNDSFENEKSESEEIFKQSSRGSNSIVANTVQFKRVNEVENTSYPERNRSMSTVKPKSLNETPKNIVSINSKRDDFNFKKPQLPFKKLGVSIRDTDSDILLVKPSQTLVGNVEPTYSQFKKALQPFNSIEQKEKRLKSKDTQQLSQNHTDIGQDKILAETTHNSTDVSTKPSFIKRKLFTQKLDVIENKNLSSDNLGLNSPQAKLLKTCREKNKVRKLTSQSCLSHDVPSDNNYLDLIHKIVPPDQINATSISNKKDVNKNRKGKDDKWDVMSAISMCIDDDASDTYTDEEIFKGQDANKTAETIKKHSDKRSEQTRDLQKNQGKVVTQCKVVIEKLAKPSSPGNKTELHAAKYPNKDKVSKCVRLFWGTDFESDTDDDGKKNPGSQIHMSSPKNFSHVNNDKKNEAMESMLTVRSLRNRSMKTSFDNMSDVSKRLKCTVSKNVHEQNNNNNEIHKRIQSQSRIKEASKRTLGEKFKNNKSDVSSKVKSSEPKTNKKEKTSFSANSKESPQHLNISRASLRQRKDIQTSFNSSSSPSVCTRSQIMSNKCNTSRESVRLKQKREAKLKSNTHKECLFVE